MITFILFSAVLVGYVVWGFFRLLFGKNVTEQQKTDIKLGFIFAAVCVAIIYFMFR